MKDSDKQSLGEHLDDSLLSATPETLETLARSYFSTEFPNPRRHDCPPQAELVKLANSRELPDGVLRAHLFSCSQCFLEFSSAMPQQELKIVPRRTGITDILTFRPLPSLIALACLVLFSVVVLLALRQSQTPTIPADGPQIAQVNQAESVDDTKHGTSEPLSDAKETDQKRDTLVAVSKAYVDLGKYSAIDATRGLNSNGPKRSIVINSFRTNIDLKLPEGSASGRYTVSVVDPAFLETIVSANGMSDGKTLEIPLNLRVLKDGKFLLAISREGETPSYYPLIIKVGKR